MSNQVAAKIFLADNRSIVQSKVQRVYHTIDEANHKVNYFSGIYGFADGELAGGASAVIAVHKPSYLLLLPITGDILFTNLNGGTVTIDNGTLQIFPISSAFTLSNPFDDEVINYLQVLIESNTEFKEDLTYLFHFDLDQEENQIISFNAPALPFTVGIGRFKGRKESKYILQHTDNSLYSFVIAGAFEVEHRLLQMRDGLGISAIKEIDFEALSENAILFFIELFGHPVPHLGNIN